MTIEEYLENLTSESRRISSSSEILIRFGEETYVCLYPSGKSPDSAQHRHDLARMAFDSEMEGAASNRIEEMKRSCVPEFIATDDIDLEEFSQAARSSDLETAKKIAKKLVKIAIKGGAVSVLEMGLGAGFVIVDSQEIALDDHELANKVLAERELAMIVYDEQDRRAAALYNMIIRAQLATNQLRSSSPGSGHRVRNYTPTELVELGVVPIQHAAQSYGENVNGFPLILRNPERNTIIGFRDGIMLLVDENGFQTHFSLFGDTLSGFLHHEGFEELGNSAMGRLRDRLTLGVSRELGEGYISRGYWRRGEVQNRQGFSAINGFHDDGFHETESAERSRRRGSSVGVEVESVDDYFGDTYRMDRFTHDPTSSGGESSGGEPSGGEPSGGESSGGESSGGESSGGKSSGGGGDRSDSADFEDVPLFTIGITSRTTGERLETSSEHQDQVIVAPRPDTGRSRSDHSQGSTTNNSSNTSSNSSTGTDTADDTEENDLDDIDTEERTVDPDDRDADISFSEKITRYLEQKLAYELTMILISPVYAALKKTQGPFTCGEDYAQAMNELIAELQKRNIGYTDEYVPDTNDEMWVLWFQKYGHLLSGWLPPVPFWNGDIDPPRPDSN